MIKIDQELPLLGARAHPSALGCVLEVRCPSGLSVMTAEAAATLRDNLNTALNACQDHHTAPKEDRGVR